MKSLLTLALTFTFVASAHALELSSEPVPYTDSIRFTQQEEVGIHLLTDLGAITGNPDGSFAVGRTLNRAEFLKIVLLSHPAMNPNQFVPDDCFPDINRTDWFSQYVCFAKAQNIVDGYPDGAFKPGNPVNYAEALKILSELYQHPINTEQNDIWFEPYLRIAESKAIYLTDITDPAAPLTRGQMARMAAAYRVESTGDLAAYRQLERGQSSSSSEVQEEDETEEESSSSESSIESSSSSSAPELDPLTIESGFLFPGEVGLPLAKGEFVTPIDTAVRTATIRFNTEIYSFSSLELLDGSGNILGELFLRFGDSDDDQWQVELAEELPLAEGESITVYVRPTLKTVAEGARSGEYIKVEDFYLSAQSGNTSIELRNDDVEMTTKNVVVAHVTGIENTGEAAAGLSPGRFLPIGTFAVVADTANAPINVKRFNFIVNTTGTVSVKSPSLRDDEGNSIDCQLSNQTITCIIPNTNLALVRESKEFTVIADVSAMDSSGILQLSLPNAGAFDSAGSMHWTDGATEYSWVQLESPLVEMTEWKVK